LFSKPFIFNKVLLESKSASSLIEASLTAQQIFASSGYLHTGGVDLIATAEALNHFGWAALARAFFKHAKAKTKPTIPKIRNWLETAAGG